MVKTYVRGEYFEGATIFAARGTWGVIKICAEGTENWRYTKKYPKRVSLRNSKSNWGKTVFRKICSSSLTYRGEYLIYGWIHMMILDICWPTHPYQEFSPRTHPCTPNFHIFPKHIRTYLWPNPPMCAGTIFENLAFFSQIRLHIFYVLPLNAHF